MVLLKVIVISMTVLIITQSCSKEGLIQGSDQKEILRIPEGFPNMSFPSDNEFSESRWVLGKKLFFDPILSIDSTISCASCHKPSISFSDDVALSNGVKDRMGVRNSPSLANVGYHPYYLREGGVPTLEMQVLVPIQEHNEFNHNIVDISEQLLTIPEYVELSQTAYNRNPDPFVITRAIATFERSLISGNSAYDLYQNGNNNALSSQEIKGMNLFFSSKTNCSSCHGGFNFTDYSFQNNGLFTNYEDIGRMRITNDSSDLALFKVPSLRNVMLTAPYMHSGQIKTLEEVIEHYNNGGVNYFNKSTEIVPLNLTNSEKTDLLAFLKSLTDYEFISNVNWN